MTNKEEHQSNLIVYREDLEQFNKDIKTRRGLIILIFFATWDQQSRRLATQLVELAKEFNDVYFYKIDVDANASITDHYKPESPPFFIFFIREIYDDGREPTLSEVDKFRFINVKKLREKIEENKLKYSSKQ